MRQSFIGLHAALFLSLALTVTGRAEFQPIDNFDDREIGLLDGQGGWETSDLFEVEVDPTDPANKVLSVLDGGVSEATLALENPLEDETTGTLFFRFLTNEDTSHVNWGLSDLELPTVWNDFEAQIRDEQVNPTRLDFRDGGGFTQLDTELEPEEWIKVWMVINNGDDETIGYIQTENSIPEQTRLTAGGQDAFLFRNGTDDPLVTFFIRNGVDHVGDWYLDDIYLDISGENLSDPTGSSIPGDFDGSGLLDLADINALNMEIGSGGNSPQFDLNGSSTIDTDDLAVWIKDLKNTWFGDANLDGEFNSSDFVTVFGAGLFETEQPADWSQGDWNGDGEFNSGDFVVAFSDGGFELGPRVAEVVPEPSTITLLLISLFGLTRINRRFM